MRVLISSIPDPDNVFFLGSFPNDDFVVFLYLTEAYNLQCELAACHAQQMDLSMLLPGSQHVHQALCVWHPFPNQNVKTAVCEGLLHLH